MLHGASNDGEPFVRRNLVPFIGCLSEVSDIDDISLITNGVLTAPYLPELVRLSVAAVNLSLGTLDRAHCLRLTAEYETRC